LNVFFIYIKHDVAYSKSTKAEMKCKLLMQFYAFNL